MSVDVNSLYHRRADNRWDRTAVGDMLERVALVRPDAEAMVGVHGGFGDPEFERVTYKQADQWANRFANTLLAHGLERGDRVLMLCENSIEAMIAKFGIAKAGCVAVPINPHQVPEFIVHVLRVAEPKLVLADLECQALAAAVGRSVDVSITIGDAEFEGLSFREFCETGDVEPAEVTIHGDDIWQLLFTSGTTAMPKAVMISHTYTYLVTLAWVPTMVRGLRQESQVRVATFAPVIFHVGDQGYVMPALMAGGTAIIGRSWNAPSFARTIQTERATLALGGGHRLAMQLLEALERLGPEAASSLTCFFHATGMLTRDELARVKALAPGISVMYLAGQTECCTGHRFVYDTSDQAYGRALENQLNMIGVPTPLLASMVVSLDDSNRFVGHGVEGELVYRSPATTPGYYRDKEATEKAFEGGWFHSGDMGTTEPEGDRTMTGRIKDLIRTGGENVAAVRVEGVVRQHPDVADVAVIGLPDERWGEAVTAVVVAHPGRQIDEHELIKFCRTLLSGYETPKRVIVADELPLGLGAKVLKHELRRRYGPQASR